MREWIEDFSVPPLEAVCWGFFNTPLEGMWWIFSITLLKEWAENFSVLILKEWIENFSALLLKEQRIFQHFVCMYVCVLPISKNVFKYNLLEKKKFRKTKLMTWELIYPDEEHAFRFLDQREADKFRGKKCWVKDNVYWATKGIVIMKPRQQWWGGKYDLSGLLSLS